MEKESGGGVGLERGKKKGCGGRDLNQLDVALSDFGEVCTQWRGRVWRGRVYTPGTDMTRPTLAKGLAGVKHLPVFSDGLPPILL